MLKDAMAQTSNLGAQREEEASSDSTFWQTVISGGYGQLVLRDLLAADDLYDQAYGETYQSACQYHRNSDELTKLNLYTEGLASVLEELEAARFPAQHDVPEGRQSTISAQRLAESFEQDELIYTADDYNEFKAETNRDSTRYGEAFAAKRR